MHDNNLDFVKTRMTWQVEKKIKVLVIQIPW